MSRILVCALLLAVAVSTAWSQLSKSESAQQQAATAAQQSQTALQQSQTALQQSQTAMQQSQTAQQQMQTAQQLQQQAQKQTQEAETGMTPEERAALKDKQAQRLRDARDVMKAAFNEKSGISKNLTDKAKCVVVIPSVKKVAVGLGMDYGRGAMSCRLGENFNGPWSAPSMTALEGGNIGFQIGVQATDLVLLVMNERGVESLLKTKSRLGGDVSVAAGPVGRQMMAATDVGMRAQILSYSHTGGVFAGVSVTGSSLRPDNSGNESLYDRELTARQIVRSGEVAVPPAGRPFIQTLEEATSSSAAAATPAGQNK